MGVLVDNYYKEILNFINECRGRITKFEFFSIFLIFCSFLFTCIGTILIVYLNDNKYTLYLLLFSIFSPIFSILFLMSIIMIFIIININLIFPVLYILDYISTFTSKNTTVMSISVV